MLNYFPFSASDMWNRSIPIQSFPPLSLLEEQREESRRRAALRRTVAQLLYVSSQYVIDRLISM